MIMPIILTLYRFHFTLLSLTLQFSMIFNVVTFGFEGLLLQNSKVNISVLLFALFAIYWTIH